jgi:predicted O-linked N-acetylglucosamine transferase (SPINDLY family)
MSDEPRVHPPPAMASGIITFGCLNNPSKINADVVKLWSRVMKAVERSRIIVFAAATAQRRQLLAQFQAEEIEADRVEFVGFHPHQQYLELYQRIDIGLDTFPYNGHSTGLDSYWMGVPVVTLVGPTVVGRAGYSQLMNLGLPSLIAQSPADFVRIATELACDLPRLRELRATLRSRMRDSPLMDARRFAASIESAYREMWQKWCAAR